jgi:hypothetical protein
MSPADLHQPDRLIGQAVDFLDYGPGLLPVAVFVDVFHKDIITTEGTKKKHWKIGAMVGILETSIVYPPFHYSFLFLPKPPCSLCLCGESFFSR